ncbi:MAG: hypothetical protein JRF60_14955 [Deltaproteobacteria bacterium]|nr:hypothetical protein [Deltaproteobacteria bacterium]MBW2564911.1 hypothetical protein [Deltaproteobacteria bacterium]
MKIKYMKVFDKKKEFIADDENFIALVKVLKEDYKIRSKIEPILSLDKFNRKSALNTWLEQLKFQQAPEKIISLLSCLIDDDIAKKLLFVIKE